MSQPVVAVVGGGLTGLAAALTLAGAQVSGGQSPPGPPCRVVLLEAEGRLGGRVRTEELAGQLIDVGPDAFLARVPEALALCQALGLGDDLVAPATGRAFIWTRGCLRALPEGLVLGVPTRLSSLARSGLVSRRGLARAALDLVLPRARLAGPDRSVGELVSARLGAEVLDCLVDPLLGGIHAGDCRRLSLGATAPQLASAAGSSRSLMQGLRAQAAGLQAAGQPGRGGGLEPEPEPCPGAEPALIPGTEGGAPALFLTLASGLGTLVEAMGAELVGRGVDLRTAAPVQRLDLVEGRWRLATPAGTVAADAVVLATPAPAAGRLVAPHAPAVASELGGIQHASVVVVSLLCPAAGIAHRLDGSGFLVPRREGRLMTACTWSSSKWPHLAQPGRALLRASAGRWGDDRALEMEDGDLVDHLCTELAEAVGLKEAPIATRVTRWPSAFPQYQVGHLERLARIEAGLANLGLAVAGASYRGIGLPACAAQGRQAAEATLARLHGLDRASRAAP